MLFETGQHGDMDAFELTFLAQAFLRSSADSALLEDANKPFPVTQTIHPPRIRRWQVHNYEAITAGALAPN